MSFVIIGLDADGTLIDSFFPHLMAVNYLLQKYGKESLTAEEFKKLNKDYTKFYEERGIFSELNELNKTYRPAFKVLVEEWMPPLFPGTEETLMFLGRLARLVLVTSQQREIIDFYNKYNTYFLRFFNKNNIFFVKNDIGKYSVLKEIKECDPNRREHIYVFISDTPDDLLAAQRAGWKVYGVTTGFSSKQNLENVISRGNGGLIDSLPELKSMFKDLF